MTRASRTTRSGVERRMMEILEPWHIGVLLTWGGGSHCSGAHKSHESPPSLACQKSACDDIELFAQDIDPANARMA